MKSRFWLWFPVILVGIILGAKEWSILPHLNQVFFGDFHDAIKNYYTVLYHVKWDSAYSHFEGMNFPFGEHVLFTDNQPILSGTLRFIQRNLFDVSQYIPAILNGLMLISFLLCAWFLNLCLRRLGTKPWFAALVSVGIVFFSPQLNRIQRHFALSYSFIIPLLLYLALVHIDQPRWKRSWLIAGTVIAVSFIHAYYLGFALLIFGCLFLFTTLKDFKGFQSKAFHFAIQALVPLIVVQMIMILTDSIVDRPAYPWSPFMGNFIPQGFIINYDNPVSVWYSNTTGMRFVDWEAKAYLGIYTIFFILLGTLASIISRIRNRNFISSSKYMNDKMYFLILAAISAILVSLAYSLLSGNTDLYQLMGPFRQFRAVGRFYWISFFALNLVSFTWLSHWYAASTGRIKGMALIAALALLGFDAYHASKKNYHRIHEEPLFLSGTGQQKLMAAQLDGVDVLIPLPYFHIGSEDFALTTNQSRHYKNSMAVSYAAGIPMSGNVLSRTSLQQTLGLLNYRYWPLDTPRFLDPLQSKNVALIIDKEAELSFHEKLLLRSGGDTIMNQEEYWIQEFDPSRYQRAFEQEDSINLYFSSGSVEGLWTFRNYEGEAPYYFSGQGCKTIPEEGNRIVDTISLPAEYLGKVTIGVWVYLYESTKASEGFVIDFLSKEKLIKSANRQIIRNNLKSISKNWGYVEFSVTIPENCTSLVILQSKNRLRPTPTYVDDLRVTLTNYTKPYKSVDHDEE